MNVKMSKCLNGKDAKINRIGYFAFNLFSEFQWSFFLIQIHAWKINGEPWFKKAPEYSFNNGPCSYNQCKYSTCSRKIKIKTVELITVSGGYKAYIDYI